MRVSSYLLMALVVFLSGCNTKYGVISQKIVDRDISGAKQLIEKTSNKLDLIQLNDDPVGITSLHLAAKYGDIELIGILIKKGVNVNETQGNRLESGSGIGITPLMVAAKFGQVKAMQFLIKNGADINLKTKYHGSALHFAAERGEIEPLKILLNSKTKVDKNALTILIANAEPSVVEYFIKNTEEIKDDEILDAAFLAAVQHRKIETIKLFVKKGAPKDKKIFKSAYFDTVAPVRFGKGAQWIEPSLEVTRYLDGLGITVDVNDGKRGNSVSLINALMRKEYEAAAYLIRKGANPSSVSKNGFGQVLPASAWLNKPGIKNQVDSYLEKFKQQDVQQKKLVQKKKLLAERNARKKAKAKLSARFTKLKRKEKCRMKENKWVYLSSSCKGRFADGQGVALHSNGELKFKGVIKSGIRVNGVLSYAGTPMFDGSLKNSRPNGKGVCFHEGEPEECKYYSGKRIDVIYKQRQENLKQQRAMDKKMAEMKRMQDEQNKKISQIQNRVESNRSASQSGGGGVGQQIGDYALRKAGEKVMDSLFDRLF